MADVDSVLRNYLTETFENGPFLLSKGKAGETSNGDPIPFYADTSKTGNNAVIYNFGYGYNINAHGTSAISAAAKAAVKAGTMTQDAADHLQKAITALNKVMKGGYSSADAANTSIAKSVSSELLSSTDWRPLAQTLMDNYFTDTADPDLQKRLTKLNAEAELSSFTPETQAALEDLEYNTGGTFLGPNIVDDLVNGDLASAAFEMAYNTYTPSGKPRKDKKKTGGGPEYRAMVDAMVLLGFHPTISGSNFISGLAGTPKIFDVLGFLEQTATSKDSATHGTMAAYRATDAGKAMLKHVNDYMVLKGFYVAQPGDTLTTIAKITGQNAALLTRLNASSTFKVANLTVAGTVIHVPVSKSAVGATPTQLNIAPGQTAIQDPQTNLWYVFNPTPTETNSNPNGNTRTYVDLNGKILGITSTVVDELTAYFETTPKGVEVGGESVAIQLGGGGAVNNGGWTINGGQIGLLIQDGLGTLINGGLISGTTGVGVQMGGDGTVANDDSISGVTGILIGGAGTLTNLGSITATSGDAVLIETGGYVTNDAGGSISGGTGGVDITGGAGQILDYGSIVASAASGIGAELGDGGLIDLETSASVLSGGDYGVLAYGATTVDNSGAITGTAAVALEIGGAGTVANDDSISGAEGVLIGGAGTLTNLGSITATSGDAVLIETGGYVTNDAGGSISGGTGGVDITGGAAQILDYGSIIASAASGIGAELGDGGLIDLETSASVLSGGDYGVLAYGATTVDNSGAITGTAAVALEIGGAGTVANDDSISGAEGVLIGGAGTLTNLGLITATSGEAVLIETGGYVTNDAGGSISGGTGGVDITGGWGQILDYGSIVASAASGIGAELGDGGLIDLETSASVLSGGDYGVLAYGAATVDNSGEITGTAAVALEIGGAGTVANDDSISGAEGVLIGGAGKLTNQGSITATSGDAVLIETGGYVTNDAGESISGGTGGVDITGGWGQILDYGSILASAASGIAAELGDGGLIDLETSASVLSGGDYGVLAYGAATVDNSGAITGTAAVALEIGGAGTVANDDSISGAEGVLIGGEGKLTNQGSIKATSGDAVLIETGGDVTNDAGESISGGTGGVDITGGSGQILDYGSIIASAASGIAAELGDGGLIDLETSASVLSGGDYGVLAYGGGTVSNHGSITGKNAVGVEIGGAGTLDNYGTITGAIGLIMEDAGATLHNYGTITGTGGIAAELGSNQTLALGGGGGFVGKVMTSGQADDTLELTASGGDGSLSGLGTTLTAFSGLLIDAGAQWTLTDDDVVGSMDDQGDVDIGDSDDGLFAAAFHAAQSPASVAAALSLSGALSGTGVVTLAAGATLTVGSAAAGGEIAFTKGGSETFSVTGASAPEDTMTNFGVDDHIDLAGLTFANSFKTQWKATSSGGTLKIVDSAHADQVMATLLFSGAYVGDAFTLHADKKEGTSIGLVLNVSSVASHGGFG